VKAGEYGKMYRAELEFWWFAGKGRLVEEWAGQWLMAGAEHLDVGCGTGANLERVSGTGRWTGLDNSAEAIGFCVERGHQRLCRGEAQGLPFAAGSFDGAMALDVLEHADNDKGMVEEIFRVLRPGGRVIVTAPAYPILWSAHDLALGHKRRYTRGLLRELLEEEDFRVLRLTHFMGFLFPAMFLGKLLQQWFGDPGDTISYEWPGWANRALGGMVSAEIGWLKKHGMPWGTTLLAVAEKPR